MGKYSKKDIMRIVADEDVEFIRMQFTDIFGQLKNVAITASQLEKALNNQIMIDGSSSRASPAFTRATSTSTPTPTASPSCPGPPAQAAPRASSVTSTIPTAPPSSATRAACSSARSRRPPTWATPSTLAPSASSSCLRPTSTAGPTTKTGDEAGYFDLGPVDHGEFVRRDICLALEAMGFEIEASHHEVAPRPARD